MEMYSHVVTEYYQFEDSNIEYQKQVKKLNTLLEIKSRSSDEMWLPDLNLGFTEVPYLENNEQICDSILNNSMLIIRKEAPTFKLMPTFSRMQAIDIHHSSKGHFVT